MDTIRVALSPSSGFCVKSVALQPAVCKVTPRPQGPPERLDGPSVASATLTIPKGVKVFVNIAWDRNVPPPPEGSEEVIQRAMLGEEPDAHNEKDWFVPVVVSEPREDRDKAGKPSVVFDCVYNSALKPRALKDPAFKTFLIELALQRIETQHAVPLSRQIGTPNIRSKGELHPRSVLIPAALFADGHLALSSSSSTRPAKKLVEEVAAPASRQPRDTPKGILKTPATAKQSVDADASPQERTCPELSWSKDADQIRIILSVPRLTRADIPSATLDLERRRLILDASPLYALDLNLDIPDAQIGETLPLSKSSVDQALTLKRQRNFNADSARAEWRVAEGRLVVYV